MLHALCAFCGSGCIHGCVASADNYHMFSKLYISVLCLELFQEFSGVHRLSFFQLQYTGHAGSGCEKYSIKALVFQLFCGAYFFSQFHFYTHFSDDGSVFFYGFFCDPEIRDHMCHNSAKSVFFFKNSDIRTASCKEVSCCHTGGTAADDCRFPAVCLFGNSQFFHNCIVCFLGCLQLHISDMYRLLIEVSGTFAHTVVGTDGSCDKRKRILVEDHLKCLLILSGRSQFHIIAHILMDRTSRLTGSHKTVHKGNTVFYLAVWKGLYGFYMVHVTFCVLRKFCDCFHINSCKRLQAFFYQKFSHLRTAVVSARF